MAISEIILNGKVVRPLLTRSHPGSAFVAGEDEQGPYVACRLGVRDSSLLYGWYAFVSPADLPLLKADVWCGYVTHNKRGNPVGVGVRRRKTIGGKQYSILLGQEIWRNTHGNYPLGKVYRLGHPLDFRRMNLSQFPSGQNHGIVWHKDNEWWQVQITMDKKTRYIGKAALPDDGYRMYNQYLRELQLEFSHDVRIQSMPFNEVDPKF